MKLPKDQQIRILNNTVNNRVRRVFTGLKTQGCHFNIYNKDDEGILMLNLRGIKTFQKERCAYSIHHLDFNFYQLVCETITHKETNDYLEREIDNFTSAKYDNIYKNKIRKYGIIG